MKRYSMSEVCKLTQVSVRTLHYYDEIGLLKPSHRTSKGHRFFSESDMLRLQQIMTFKFMGVSLVEIKKLLQIDKCDMRELLKLQTNAITQEIVRLKKISKFLNYLNQHHHSNKAIDWTSAMNIMTVFKKNKNQDWYQGYLSSKEIEKLKQSENKHSHQWKILFKEIKKNIDANPEGPLGLKFIQQCAALANSYKDQTGLTEKLWEAYQAGVIPNKNFPHDKQVVAFLSRAYKKFKQSI